MSSLEESDNDLCLKLLKLLIKESIFSGKGLTHIEYEEKRIKKIKWIIKKLSLIPENIIIENIQRQRLLFFFKKNKFIKELLPRLSEEIEFLFKKEIFICLYSASVTRELSLFLNKNGIKHLFLKGIPLSLQTTNSIIGRGASKDIDILIEPTNILKTIGLLKQIGFNLPLLNKPYIDKSICGKFSRFINNELTLYRENDSSDTILLDLHWRESFHRSLSQDFNKLFKNKQTIFINKDPIYTLSKVDAFKSICHNSYIENWMSLRALIDIDTLSKMIDKNQILNIRHDSIVKRSCAVTYKLTKNNHLKCIAKKISNKQIKIDNEYSHLFQSLDWRSLGKGNWNIKNRIFRFKRLLLISFNLNDWLALILEVIIPVRDLIDVKNGKFRNILDIIFLRIYKLKKHLFYNKDCKNNNILI